MQTWETLIDKGSLICGGQNALARRIGAEPTHLAQARQGRRPISRPQLEAMADVLELDPAELWEAQELANMPRRNPFRRKAAGIAVALIAVILSTLWPAESSMAARLSARSALDHGRYIVAH